MFHGMSSSMCISKQPCKVHAYWIALMYVWPALWHRFIVVQYMLACSVKQPVLQAVTSTAAPTVWREEGKGADPAAVAAALVALLLAYLDLALPEPSDAYLQDHAEDEKDMQVGFVGHSHVTSQQVQQML